MFDGMAPGSSVTLLRASAGFLSSVTQEAGTMPGWYKTCWNMDHNIDVGFGERHSHDLSECDDRNAEGGGVLHLDVLRGKSWMFAVWSMEVYLCGKFCCLA